jgi:hypothetical protein
MLRFRWFTALSALILISVAAGASAVTPLGKASAPGASAAPAMKTAAPKMVLPWIDDDWQHAVAVAKARKLPIFVESWAPW